MDLRPLFTTDEEFEVLEDQDVTTITVGYVNSISAPSPAGSNNDILFKFILSNGNREIPILIWGSALINKYYKDICISRVVRVNGGYCRAVSQSKIRHQDNLVPFEIIIKEYTAVDFLGFYGLENQSESSLQKTTFDDIHAVQGSIQISGYIRTKFSLVHNRNGLMTYGIGAITDGHKKITVQIKQFTECKLEVGDYVTVKGTVKGQDALVTIFCNSMNDIEHDSETDPLSAESVQRGGRPVKRVRSSDKKND